MALATSPANMVQQMILILRQSMRCCDLALKVPQLRSSSSTDATNAGEPQGWPCTDHGLEFNPSM